MIRFVKKQESNGHELSGSSFYVFLHKNHTYTKDKIM